MKIDESEIQLAAEALGFGDRILPRGIQTDEYGAKLLRSFISGLTRVATTQHANELVARQRLVVVKSDICNACAVQIEDDPVVLVFRGLVKALIFVVEFGEMVELIHKTLVVARSSRLRMEELQDKAYAAYSLLYSYQAIRSPLPRPGDVLPPAVKREKLLTFSKVFWFIFMHEIGHIQLGHLRPGSVTSALTNTALVVPEALDDMKLKEFEADLFLCDSLTPTEQHRVLSYVTGPLDMLASLERNLGGDGESHPLAVNRMQHFLGSRRDSIDELSREVVVEMIARNVTAIQALKEFGSRFMRTPVERSREALADLQHLYSECLRSSPGASDEDVGDARLWDFFVSYFWHDGELDAQGRVPHAT
jgi:hypothetical protein